MRTVTFYKTGKNKTLHIETELCVVNIRVGLHDTKGREVTSISIKPDGVENGQKIKLSGTINNRVIKLKGRSR